MSKLSVKKPMTVLVAVIAILVLGFVSFTNMTPDLLPNLDVPYIVVQTGYPGATPEKVETAISKPLEKTMSTLEHIKTVQSVSNENQSMLILEFDDEVDMDAATVDILQKISQIQDYWDESVTTPFVLKLNPSMLPVMVAAVEMKGKDAVGLSSFVKDTLLNKLEGTAGVASINASGILQEEVQVIISQKQIDALNKKIFAAVDEEINENSQELRDAKTEAESKKADIEQGKTKADEGAKELAEKTASGEAEIGGKKTEMTEGKVELVRQIDEMVKQKKTLEDSKKSLSDLKKTYDQLTKAKKELVAALQTLEQAKTAYEGLQGAKAQFDEQIRIITESPELTPEMKEAAIAQITTSPPYIEVMAGIAAIEEQLAAGGISPQQLDGKIAETNATLAEVDANIAKIEQALAAQGIQPEKLQSSIKEIEKGITQLEKGIKQMQDVLTQLETGSMQIAEAEKQLSETKTSALYELGGATAQLVVGEGMLSSALEQIDDGLEKVEDAREDAYEQADLENIITMDMVSNILRAQNFTMPVGYAQDGKLETLVRVGEEFASVEELQNMMLLNLQMDGLSPIYLSDVAEVILTDNASEIYAKINGNDGVVLSFNKQSAYATAEVSDNLAAKFEQLSNEFDGLKFETLMDQGDYIYMVVSAIFQNLLLGALFAVIILFLFLRDLRPTLITLCSIPISVLFALVLMYFSGVTLNIISLSGLAVAVGMLVDNSVVVIENIYRLRGEGVPAMKAAVAGAKQVGGAIMASTLTTICVFFPIVFVQGLTRQLFTDMALTLAYSLLASLIVALTLVPAMSSRLLKNAKPKPTKTFAKVLKQYGKMAHWALKHKAVVMLASVALLVLSTVLAFSRGFIFMPEMSMPELDITMQMPEGSEKEETMKMADVVQKRIMEMEEVETVGSMLNVGSIMSMGSGGGGDNSAMIYVRLSEKAGQEGSKVAKQINSMFDDLNCEVSANSSSMDMSAMGGSGIALELYGENADDLQTAAKQVETVLDGMDAVQEADSGIGETSPELRFVVNKDKATENGLTVAQVFAQLNDAMKVQEDSTKIRYEGNDYSVIIKTGKTKRNLDFVKSYMLKTKDKDGEEKLIPITDVAEMVQTETANSITRLNQRRVITPSATLKDGENISIVSAQAEKLMKAEKLPDGVTYEFTGENKTIVDAMVDLVKMLLLGVLLVYLIMVAQFQSLKSPFIVMFTIPLAFTGGFFALAITGLEVSVIAMIGFIMLCGIIVNNGIVLVDYINQLRQGGIERREAIVQAGITRMRPILMTSITTILGLITMALGMGMGASLMQPIAIVCIGGLTYATLLTLFVIPVIYDAFNRKERKTVAENELSIDGLTDEAQVVIEQVLEQNKKNELEKESEE